MRSMYRKRTTLGCLASPRQRDLSKLDTDGIIQIVKPPTAPTTFPLNGLLTNTVMRRIL